MENATKALIIAAAVLVAILVISLGIGIFNKASESVDVQDGLDEVEMAKKTQRFFKYEGDKVSGSEVNAMLREVANYNMAQKDTSTTVQVFLYEEELIDESNNRTTLPRKLSTDKTYRGKCYFGENTKRVRKIDIWINN